MPPRYYLDEDVSHPIAPLVRAAGHDVLTTRDAGRNGTPDDEQLRFATGQGRVLVTRNYSDFAGIARAWLAQGRHHAGLLFVPPSLENNDLRAIAAAIAAHATLHAGGVPVDMSDWLRPATL